MRNEPIFDVWNLVKDYCVGGQPLHALKGVSFSVFPGETVALVGTSGSGKSTLLNLLGCLDTATSGVYRLLGRDVACLSQDERAALRNRSIGFVFQNYNLLGRITALENVGLPMVYRGSRRADRQARARELLKLVGLEDRQDHEPMQLSGGQQQRVAIARALINGPKLLLADEPTGNLDSETSKEILALFRKLNEETGITIILVTHDREVARQMNRVISLTDGVIEKDERFGPTSSGEFEAGIVDPPSEERRQRGALLTNIRTALGALRVNKLRSALTILGVVIGVATVIAMRATSQGAQENVAELLERLGRNRITVYAGSSVRGGRSQGAETSVSLTAADAEAIVRNVPDIRAVAPLVRGNVQVVNGNRNWATRLYGTTGAYLDIMDWPLQLGTNLNDADVRGMRKVALLGKTPVRELFGGGDAVGEIIRIGHLPFTVVGILEERGSSFGYDLDDLVIVPLSTAQRRILGVRHVRYIEVGATTQEATVPVQNHIRELLRVRHQLRDGDKDDFRVRNAAMVVEASRQAIGILSYTLGVIAFISLAVGGIGIMNIMLVSVTERTREIGIRLALGARQRDVRAQFLTEAVILSLVGGIVGALLGISVSALVTFLGGIDTGYIGVVYTPVSANTVLLAVGFAAAVGIFFGYHPAAKAARMNPIDALRYE